MWTDLKLIQQLGFLKNSHILFDSSPSYIELPKRTIPIHPDSMNVLTNIWSYIEIGFRNQTILYKQKYIHTITSKSHHISVHCWLMAKPLKKCFLKNLKNKMSFSFCSTM